MINGKQQSNAGLDRELDLAMTRPSLPEEERTCSPSYRVSYVEPKVVKLVEQLTPGLFADNLDQTGHLKTPSRRPSSV